MSSIHSFQKKAFLKYITKIQEDTVNVLRYKTSQLEDKCNELKECKERNIELESTKSKMMQRETVLVKLLNDERMKVKQRDEEIVLLRELINNSSAINEGILIEVEQIVAQQTNGENVESCNKSLKVEYEEILITDSDTDDEAADDTEIDQEMDSLKHERSESELELELENVEATDADLGERIDENLIEKDIDEECNSVPPQLVPTFSQQFDDQSDISVGCEFESPATTGVISAEFKDERGKNKRKREKIKPYALEITNEFNSGSKRRKGPKTTWKRKNSCGYCEGCMREECRECRNCKDKPKFGGENKIKQKCIERKCKNIV